MTLVDVGEQEFTSLTDSDENDILSPFSSGIRPPRNVIATQADELQHQRILERLFLNPRH